MTTKKLIVVVGPTAAGKTAYAVRLAQELGTEIVSCDSRQFYRELDIGVARPSPDELQAAKHHFIACRSITEGYDAYRYSEDALQKIAELHRSHDSVIAVGGSGLYIDALCHGIAQMPDPTPELRQQLQQQLRDEGIESLRRRLKLLDPEYYQRVDLANPARLQRALEVCLTTGEPYSKVINQTLQSRPFAVETIGISRERDELRHRIDTRVDRMMAEGLLDEVRSHLPYRNLQTLNTVGYKELMEYLDGRCTHPDAVLRIKQHTWQYAKKQLTWLHRNPAITWLPGLS